MKEVPYMYRLKPICGLNARVELPKCMYRLRQIQGSVDPTDVMHDNILAKSSYIEEKVKILIKDNLPAVKTLEQRQEAILGQLRNLKLLVEELSRQLKAAPSTSPSRGDQICLNKRLQEDEEVLRVVVKASPSRLPHALLAAIRLWCPHSGDTTKVNVGELQIRWYSHSTVTRPVPSFPSCNPGKSPIRVQLTFIWKDAVPGGVEFCIGNSSSWLRGEAILISLLLSHLPSSVDLKNGSIVSEVALSALLDSCAAVSSLTDSISPASVKKALSAVWKWASLPNLIPSNAHSVSVGEIVLWGTLNGLCKSKDESLPPETPEKLDTWFASYSKFLGF